MGGKTFIGWAALGFVVVLGGGVAAAQTPASTSTTLPVTGTFTMKPASGPPGATIRLDADSPCTGSLHAHDGLGPEVVEVVNGLWSVDLVVPPTTPPSKLFVGADCVTGQTGGNRQGFSYGAQLFTVTKATTVKASVVDRSLPDPCTLVPQAAVEAAVGEAMRPGVNGVDIFFTETHSSRLCFWTAAAASGTSAEVIIQRRSPRQSVGDPLGVERSRAHDHDVKADSVAGLGAGAVFVPHYQDLGEVGSNLTVEERCFSMSVAAFFSDHSKDEPADVAMARVAVPVLNGAACPPKRSAFTSSVPTITEVSRTAKDLGDSGLVAVLLIAAVVFPAQLFNSAVDANHEEIRRWLARPGRAFRGLTRPLEAWPKWAKFSGFVVLAALIDGLLDPTFGADTATLALEIGLVASLAIVTLTFDLPERVWRRLRRSEHSTFEVRAFTVLIAVACVAVSRLTHFEPGYLFGLIAGFQFANDLVEDQEGRLAAVSALWLLGVGLISWIVWTPFKHAAVHPGASWPVLIPDAVLVAIFVTAIEALVFGLLPMRFLDGERVWQWSRAAWAGLYGLCVFTFVHVVLHPGVGYQEPSRAAPVVTTIALFFVFGGISVAVWLYFRNRPAPDARAEGHLTSVEPP